MRIGTGYDSHRFDASRPLVLGGVRIPDHAGLSGHSDGDAVAHAVIDALLGAAAAGSVGGHFPPGDPRWRDADSLDLLGRVTALLAAGDYRIVNVDVTVVSETPRIEPRSEEMRRRLATAMGISPAQVSVKGKTNEGMGWVGQGEGLAVHAVALIEAAVNAAG
jgi:2-C-methyl-D-erythritol 2,4-cyclodiphosphate synthase